MSTEKNIYIDIWLVSLLATRVVSELLNDSPLSVDEFAMYGLISDLAPITAADLVRATGLPPTTVSSVLRRCEARGELVRADNPQDRRSSLLSLTPKGYEVLSAVVPTLLEGIERLAGDLGDRNRQVRHALQDLDAALRRGLGLGPRPYRLQPGVDPAQPSVAYPGTMLSPAQSTEVRQFIEWIRARDA